MKKLNPFKAISSLTHKKIFRGSSESGMSLVEILIVLTLVGGLFTLIFGRVFGGRDRANIKGTHVIMKNISDTIREYKGDVGTYPPTLEALQERPSKAKGWMGPYDVDTKDAWKNEIKYTVEGKKFTLTSAGSSEEFGDKKDIVVTFPNK